MALNRTQAQHFLVVLESPLCFPNTNVEVLDRAGCVHNVHGVHNVLHECIFYTHRYTQKCIYCINLHNGKHVPEGCRRDHSFAADGAEARQECDTFA